MLKRTEPFADKSPYGWWIYGELLQWVSNRQKAMKPGSRRPVWEDYRIVRAKTRGQAYRKAMKLSQAGMPSKTEKGEWQFAGISMLLPIYEELEDGAEILWHDRGSMTVEQIERKIKSAREA